jgi:hypothetical protein
MEKLSSESGVVEVYAVDAMIGLPAAWESAVTRYQTWHRAEQVMRKSGATEGSDRAQYAETLKVKFHSCPLPGHGATAGTMSTTGITSWSDPKAKPASELRDLCKKQVDVLQQGYRGNLQCDKNNLAYEPPLGDTGIRFFDFEEDDLEFLEDDLCARCESEYIALWTKYMPAERGVLKVLLCESMGILGVSAFPWENVRGTMFDYRTLPGGGMYKYDEGKTMVHEFGHYMGLYHTFENGCGGLGDHIEDTKPEYSAFFGCPNPAMPPRACTGGLAPVHNFMDYADDRCMCAFTPNQRDRLNDQVARYIFSSGAE